MREIHYRGGMLVFRLPESWKEEDQGDGVHFYEGNAEQGSLHVSLTTVRHPNGAITEAMVRSVAATGRESGDPEAERLENGNFIRRFERVPTRDVPQLTTFWMVANAVPPQTVRYAIFNYGAPPAVAGTDSHRQTLTMLDEQIRQTRFTTLTPEEVRARQRAARPWWQFW